MPAPQKSVDDFMQRLDAPLKAEAEALRAIIKAVDPQISEQIKWNAPSYSYRGNYLVTFNFHDRAQIRLVFHNPAIASIPSSILEGDYIDRRLAYFANMDEVKSKQGELERVVATLIEGMEK